jgi:hypothetical protein
MLQLLPTETHDAPKQRPLLTRLSSLFPSTIIIISYILAFFRKAWNRSMLRMKSMFVILILICLTLLYIVSNVKEQTTNSPFVYLKVFGRLGNQLFEYACAYTLARKLGIPLSVWLPPELVNDLTNNNVNLNPYGPYSHFALHFFNISFLPREEYDQFMWIVGNNSRLVYKVTDEDLSSGTYPVRKNYSKTLFTPPSFMQFHKCSFPLFPQRNKILQIDEYCQSEHFFLAYKEDILFKFQLKPIISDISQNPSMQYWEKTINSSGESVCVHIRRGDFVSSESRLVDMSFYTDAMAEVAQILKKRGNYTSPPQYFLFSNGISYVWDYFGDSSKFNTTIQSPNRSSIRLEEQLPGEEISLHWVSRTPEMTFINDFHLMSKCRHNIMSASSFGWWGAYLGDQKDKIVIAAHYNPSFFGWSQNNKLYQFRNFYYPIGWIVKDAKFVN